MINFVEYILTGKEKVTKRKPGGFFTDDGFVIGVAYILKLIDQYKQFDALHWFEEVNARYNEEVRKLQADLSKLKKEEQQTSTLTIKKLRSYQMEFELLRFSFDGARIFFNDRTGAGSIIKPATSSTSEPVPTSPTAESTPNPEPNL